jgi:FKBP-type peptidyl-prolyl cis-trans isomerase
MQVGGTRTLAIPYDLGYGKAGSLPKIPAMPACCSKSS